MAVKFLHGSHVPFEISIPARKPGDTPSMPILTEAGGVVVQRDDTYPEYTAVFWLVSGSGKGREAVRTDAQGVVTLNLLRDRFTIGTAGVRPSLNNPSDLDVDDYLRGRIASGYVRVDHLKDENGEPLGIPSDALYNKGSREDWSAWTRRVLNPARLRQLAKELAESEDGRTLKPNWLPEVTTATARKLQTARNKEPAHVASDRQLLKDARATLVKMGDDIKAALAPSAQAPFAPHKNEGGRPASK